MTGDSDAGGKMSTPEVSLESYPGGHWSSWGFLVLDYLRATVGKEA